MPEEIWLTPFVEAWPGGRRGWRGGPDRHPLRTVTSLDDIPGLCHDVNERYWGERCDQHLLALINAEVAAVVPADWHVRADYYGGWGPGPLIDLKVSYRAEPPLGQIKVTISG